MKSKIRVVDIPTTATAAEAEALLNGPHDDGYYNTRIIQTGLPEGIGTRAFYTLRVKSERDN
jgi:hypothetical protein